MRAAAIRIVLVRPRRFAPALPFVLAFLLAAPAALAAPISVRTGALAPAGAPRHTVLQSTSAIDARCAAAPENGPQAVSDHLARGPLPEALPVTYSTDTDGIAVIEDEGTLFFNLLGDGSRKVLDVVAAAREFYRTHGDDYDALAFYLGNGQNTWLGSPTALASAYPVQNDVQGIGLDLFDLTNDFGSAGRLHTVLSMNGVHRYVDNPDSSTDADLLTPNDFLAHEFAHRWSAYVFVDSAGHPRDALLGRADQHWSFLADVDASVMEGCSWARVGPDSFYTDSVTTGYGGPDLYVMGLQSRAETDSILTIYDGHDWQPPDTYGQVHDPIPGVGGHGRAYYWKVDDIERLNGPRIPDSDHSPHAFRMAMCLVVPHGVAPTAADLAKLQKIRQRFPSYFVYATRGRGTIDLSLDSRAGSVAIAHTPLADSEDLTSPRAVGARMTIAQAGIPLALDASSPRLYWRLAGGGGWSPVAMTPAGPDSFAAAIPGPGFATDIEYYLYAASDSAGIDATDPPAGPGAPHRYSLGPDVTPPVIVHTPVHSQGAGVMPQRLLARVTDNLGVDSVWVEYEYDGGALQSTAATSAGRDSFTVSIGAGLATGHALEYRFRARDRAAAHNVASSAAPFDTLRVGDDWLFDFENGADGFTHVPVDATYRDFWHLARGWSSPAGGTAWACGADSLPYPPHTGCVLYLPFIHSIVPGTKLRFDHKYGMEQADSTHAWDGVRVMIQTSSLPLTPLVPASGYTHTMIYTQPPWPGHVACWSGTSKGWRSELFDLSSYTTTLAQISFWFLADDFQGFDGWHIDHIRLQYPNGVVTGVTPEERALMISPPRPNPARAELAMALTLPRTTRVDWALYDLQGRRVSALFEGEAAAGANDLRAHLPRALPAGLYFARLSLAGHVEAVHRVAIVK